MMRLNGGIIEQDWDGLTSLFGGFAYNLSVAVKLLCFNKQTKPCEG